MSAWNNFLTDIKAKQELLACSRNGAWYRGVSCREYNLEPKLMYRRLKDQAEANIYRAYLRTRMAQSNTGSWFHLVDMQHYGTATRLLDWTECFAVALYFALNDPSRRPSPSPRIWILNPFSLACRARGSNDKTIGDFHLDPSMDYYQRVIKNSDWPYQYPIPFYSPAPNERIRAQRGFFTVHGTDPRPLNLTCRRHTDYVDLNPEAVPEAIEFLKLAGMDDNFLFPDQMGWLKKIEEDYFYLPEEPGQIAF